MSARPSAKELQETFRRTKRIAFLNGILSAVVASIIFVCGGCVIFFMLVFAFAVF